MRTGAVILLFLTWLGWGCGGKSAADYEKDARAALDAGDGPKAVAVVDEGIAKHVADNDAATKWRLESIRLDALAQAGKGSEVVATLERLAGAYPTQVNAALYRSLANKVKAGGNPTGAIDVLAAGDKRFPAEHAAFVQAIDALKAGALDPEQVDRLKKLGYL